jgi:hypothetical protein
VRWRNSGRMGGVVAAVWMMVMPCVGDELTLTCTVDGRAGLAPAPGERFTLGVEVEGDPARMFSSVVFRIVSTLPGLVIEDYRFAPPFETGTWLDGSLPGVMSLPVTWDESMLEGGSWPIQTSDALFDNFLITDLAAPGQLLEVDVLVPADYPTGESMVIAAVVEEIADGFEIIPSGTGTVVLVDVMSLRPADLNRDGRVDSADLGLMFANWGPQKTPPEGVRNPDLNGDGVVKGEDLALLLVDWEQ